MIAELGNKEALRARVTPDGEPMEAPFRRFHLRMLHVLALYHVTLHPGAEETFGNVILRGTCPHAIAAADTLVDIDGHGPPVLGHAVLGSGSRAAARIF